MKYLIVLLLAGCSMSYEEMNQRSKYCTDRGLDARLMHFNTRGGISEEIYDVVCVDPKTGASYYTKL
jgi:hypothetical protein